jgi:hypothetical protein
MTLLGFRLHLQELRGFMRGFFKECFTFIPAFAQLHLGPAGQKLHIMTKRFFLALFSVLLLTFSAGISGQDKASRPVESITESELRDHIYFLASDYLAGRAGPSAQYEIAAQYAATQFAAGGLEPLPGDTGHMHGYFQEVPYQKVTLDEGTSWVLRTKDGEKEFRHNEDYKILEGRYLPEEPMEVVFVGYGIHEPDYGWDDFEGIDLEGKMVIVMSGAPVKKEKPVLPDSLHQQYSSMMGLQKKAMPLIKQRPAAVVLALDKQMMAMIPFDRMPSMLKDEMYLYQGPQGDQGDFRIPMVYLVKEELLQTLFQGQKTSPARIIEEGTSKYKTFVLKDLIVETRFPVKERKELTLKNVVAIVPGTDPELSKEYITVGAHLDHVSLSSGQVANGADDNASGSAGVLEIAEAVALDPPRRSVVFITYTAEEMGLQGSHYFVNAGPLAPEDIKFNVNLDMIGRTTEENKESRSHYVLGSSIYEARLVPFISEINEETIQWPLIYDFHHQYSGSSDHASYSDKGIPSFFFFSGDHRDLHTPGDDPEKIEYDKAASISRLAYLITMKLANMDEVPDFREGE